MKFNTKLLHGNFPADPQGVTLPPIYQVSVLAYESVEKLERVFASETPGLIYTRTSNSTMTAFERRVASLGGGAGAVSCALNTAAVSTALLNLLQNDDEIATGGDLFGGTLDLPEDLEKFEIHTRFVWEMTARQVGRAITPATRAVFAELTGSPQLDVVDIRAVVETTALHDIPLIIDSTTTTLALIRPLEHGADIVVHSFSKYTDNSGDAISGVIMNGGHFRWDFERFPALANYRSMGKFAYTARLRQSTWRNSEAHLVPQNVHLNCVEFETLGLRMEWLCQSALKLVELLQEQPGMVVNYPGLAGSPYRPLVESQMGGGMGGAILALRVGSKGKAFVLINALKHAHIATSIGDVRTLVVHVASTIYDHAIEQQKENAGMYDDLIRMSVSLEDIEDLKENSAQAIFRIQESGGSYGD